MATNQPHQAYNGTLFAKTPTTQDSSSVYTDKTANITSSKGQPVREIHVKFEYVQKLSHQSVPILQYHRQLLTSIIYAHGDNVTIFDKNDRPIDQPRINAITSIALLRELADIHTRDGKAVRHVIIMRLRSTISLFDIRSTTVFMTHLKNLNAYVQEHPVSIQEWDISSVGWFRDMHPNHMSYELIKSHIQSLAKKNCPAGMVLPQFELSNATAKYLEPGTNEMRTRVIQISCDRKSSKILHKILIKAFSENPIYVPWDARRLDPIWYKNSLRAQFKYLCNTYTVALYGINRAEMWHLENSIIATNLVTAVHPHRETDTVGRWNLLIHKSNLAKTFVAVQSILDNYESIVPDDPTVRAKWTVARRVGNGKTAHADEDSSGDLSYATLSMASLSSFLTIDDQSLNVTTTNTSFDLTAMEVAIPDTPLPQPMSYLQALNSQAHQQPSLTANEMRLQAMIDKVTSEFNALKAIMTVKSPDPGVTSVAASSDTLTTSTLTNESLLESLHTQQVAYQAQQEAKLAQYHAQMEAKFERMMVQNMELENKIQNQLLMHKANPTKPTESPKKNILAPDANSQAQQPDPKRQDSKATPTKNHPMSDVSQLQNP